MADDRAESIKNNTRVFAKMNLEQRTEMRRLLTEGIEMSPILRSLARISSDDVTESKELIRIIDKMNLSEVMNKRKPVANQK